MSLSSSRKLELYKYIFKHINTDSFIIFCNVINYNLWWKNIKYKLISRNISSISIGSKYIKGLFNSSFFFFLSGGRTIGIFCDTLDKFLFVSNLFLNKDKFLFFSYKGFLSSLCTGEDITYIYEKRFFYLKYIYIVIYFFLYTIIIIIMMVLYTIIIMIVNTKRLIYGIYGNE